MSARDAQPDLQMRTNELLVNPTIEQSGGSAPRSAAPTANLFSPEGAINV
jgi:hypothetical protein